MMPCIPDPPPDWPSPNRIDIFFALASAVEGRAQTHRRLRQFLELPSHTKLTESLLCTRMTWEEYYELMVAYCERACAPGTGRMDADT
jgi:hypothetical protein